MEASMILQHSGNSLISTVSGNFKLEHLIKISVIIFIRIILGLIDVPLTRLGSNTY